MEIGSAEWKNLIRSGARAIDFHIGPEQADLFALHAIELIKWTRKSNLTAITDPLEVAAKHFLDSIVPASIIPRNAVLLDIGSGGGFPGIPLKIVIPSISVTLIDASHKKVSFMRHVIRKLELKNIEALHIRAEDLAKDKAYANEFDAIVSRAISDVNTFVSISLPLLAKEGIIVAMKGMPNEAEIESVQQLIHSYPSGSENGRYKLTLTRKNYTLPYLKSERSIFILKLATCGI